MAERDLLEMLGADEPLGSCFASEVADSMSGMSFSGATSAPMPEGVTEEWIVKRLRADPFLRKRFRPLSKGCGSRIRPCILCKRQSNQPDYVFSSCCFLLWAHVETSNPDTIQGNVCMWCNGVLRRRYKGMKQQEMKDKLEKDPEEKKKFDNCRADQIAKYGGDPDALMQHTCTAGQQASGRVTRDDVVAEIFDLPGALLYPPDIFQREFGQEGSDMGYALKDWDTPIGPWRAYRVKDHGRRPLPPGVIPIRKQVTREARLGRIIDDGSDVLDKDQQRDVFRHQAQHRVLDYEDRAAPEPKAKAAAAEEEEPDAVEGGDGHDIEIDPAVEEEEDEAGGAFQPHAVRVEQTNKRGAGQKRKAQGSAADAAQVPKPQPAGPSLGASSSTAAEAGLSTPKMQSSPPAKAAAGNDSTRT